MNDYEQAKYLIGMITIPVVGFFYRAQLESLISKWWCEMERLKQPSPIVTPEEGMYKFENMQLKLKVEHLEHELAGYKEKELRSMV